MALVLAAMSLAAGAVGMLATVTQSRPVNVASFPVLGTVAAVVAAGALLLLRQIFGERLPVLLIHGWIAMASAVICLGTRWEPTPQTAAASMALLV